MEQLVEFLPFLIPLAVAQLGLLGYALYHILTHKSCKRDTMRAFCDTIGREI